MVKPEGDPVARFEREKRESIASYVADRSWRELSTRWLERAFRQKYMYNFACLGRPIIQVPADIVAFQEIVWKVRPDLIIETGIAHGGSLVLSASMLALLEYCDAAGSGAILDTAKPRRRVLGIDIDIRSHNRVAIETHPLAAHIDMIEASSIAEETVNAARSAAARSSTVMVCLDSNHTHDHVLAELNAYAPLVSRGSYCIVFDTIVEDLPANVFADRSWKPGNSPRTAVQEYLRQLADNPAAGMDGKPLGFEVDTTVEDKLLLSLAPGGYLKRV